MRLSVKTLKWVYDMIEAELANRYSCECVQKKLKLIKYVIKEYIKKPKIAE